MLTQELQQTINRAFEEADRQTKPPRDGVLLVGSSSMRLWKSAARDFPGLPVLRDVPVHRISAPTVAAVTEPAPVRTWTFRMEDPQAGWPVDQWPTPVPNPRQLGGYQATVDRLR